MKKIKLNQIRKNLSPVGPTILKTVKGGSFSGDCADAYYAACGDATCNTGQIIADLVDVGIC